MLIIAVMAMPVEVGSYLFIAALSLATAAKTSVMMLPGPMPFTRTLCGAKARAIHLQGFSACLSHPIQTRHASDYMCEHDLTSIVAPFTGRHTRSTKKKATEMQCDVFLLSKSHTL